MYPQMATFHLGDIDWYCELRVPASAEALRWTYNGAELHEVVHLLHQLGVPAHRTAVSTRPSRCNQI